MNRKNNLDAFLDEVRDRVMGSHLPVNVILNDRGRFSPDAMDTFITNVMNVMPATVAVHKGVRIDEAVKPSIWGTRREYRAREHFWDEKPDPKRKVMFETPEWMADFLYCALAAAYALPGKQAKLAAVRNYIDMASAKPVNYVGDDQGAIDVSPILRAEALAGEAELNQEAVADEGFFNSWLEGGLYSDLLDVRGSAWDVIDANRFIVEMDALFEILFHQSASELNASDKAAWLQGGVSNAQPVVIPSDYEDLMLGEADAFKKYLLGEISRADWDAYEQTLASETPDELELLDQLTDEEAAELGGIDEECDFLVAQRAKADAQDSFEKIRKKFPDKEAFRTHYENLRKAWFTTPSVEFDAEALNDAISVVLSQRGFLELGDKDSYFGIYRCLRNAVHQPLPSAVRAAMNRNNSESMFGGLQ